MFPKPQHKRIKKNKKERSEFSSKTRQEIIERYNGLCGHCGRQGHHVHHVKPKGSGGRGVATNGIYLCFKCHNLIHWDPVMMTYYINQFKQQYGPFFWMDDQDKKGMFLDV